MKEKGNPARRADINHEWVKDFLVQYAESFPPVSSLLEKNVDSCTYGQPGFQDNTFLEMWQLYDAHKRGLPTEDAGHAERAYQSVRKWLLMLPNHINSKQMKRFREYIQSKNKMVPIY